MGYIVQLRHVGVLLLLSLLAAGCGKTEQATPENASESAEPAAVADDPVRPEVYADFELVSDLSEFSDNQRQMIAILIEASKIMDDLFWKQAYGPDYQEWLASIDDDRIRRFAVMNYCPWDRLDGE